MRQLVALSLALVLLGLAPKDGAAFTLAPATPVMDKPAIINVQAQSPQSGWWERENQYQQMEQRYWRLRGKERQRYHVLQRRIADLDRQMADINQKRNAAIQEQQVLLSYR